MNVAPMSRMPPHAQSMGRKGGYGAGPYATFQGGGGGGAAGLTSAAAAQMYAAASQAGQFGSLGGVPVNPTAFAMASMGYGGPSYSSADPVSGARGPKGGPAQMGLGGMVPGPFAGSGTGGTSTNGSRMSGLNVGVSPDYYPQWESDERTAHHLGHNPTVSPGMQLRNPSGKVPATLGGMGMAFMGQVFIALLPSNTCFLLRGISLHQATSGRSLSEERLVVHPSVHPAGGMSLGVADVQVAAAGQAPFRGGRGAGGYNGHKVGGSAAGKAAGRGVEEAISPTLGRSSLLEEFRNNKNRKFTLQVPLQCASARTCRSERGHAGYYWPYCRV